MAVGWLVLAQCKLRVLQLQLLEGTTEGIVQWWCFDWAHRHLALRIAGRWCLGAWWWACRNGGKHLAGGLTWRGFYREGVVWFVGGRGK